MYSRNNYYVRVLRSFGLACFLFAVIPTTVIFACKPFHEVFKDGRDLCERIYGDAFEYVPRSNLIEYDLAYTMWFFTENNPNDATTIKRLLLGKHDLFYSKTDTCYLKSPGVTNHKDFPSPESGQGFSECFPFQRNACCKTETVQNTQVMKSSYGGKIKWDHCGQLSSTCERFFIQEACFYECDPNAGLFRKYPPTMQNKSGDYQEWQLFKLPVKGDYCDAWFTACRMDNFCDRGNIFQCSPQEQQQEPLPADQTFTKNYNTLISSTAVAIIVVLAVLLLGLLIGLATMALRERWGRPIIKPSTANSLQGFGDVPNAMIVDTNKNFNPSTMATSKNAMENA